MNLRKTLDWSLLAFVFCIPLLSTLSVRILIVTLAISLFVKGFNLRRLIERSWDLILFVIVLLVGMLYTSDADRGWSVVESNFCFLAMPIIFNKFSEVREDMFNSVFYAFALGLLIACIVSLGAAAYQFNITHDVHEFFFYRLTGFIQSHPTYLAYYLIFGLTLTLYHLYYGEGRLPRWLLIVLVIFFFGTLTLTGGSTAFVSLLLIISFFILKYILEPSTPNKTTVLLFVCSMMVLLFLVNSLSYLDEQFAVGSDYWERSGLWRAAVLANHNPLLGVGTGDYTTVLNEYYRTHGLAEFAEQNFNPHNQFISVYLSNGLLGLLVVVIMMVRPILIALRTQFTIGTLVFFPFLIYGMNEVILGRYQGIVFFAVLHQLFMAYYGSVRSNAALKEG